MGGFGHLMYTYFNLPLLKTNVTPVPHSSVPNADKSDVGSETKCRREWMERYQHVVPGTELWNWGMFAHMEICTLLWRCSRRDDVAYWVM